MSVQSGPTFKRYAANGVTTVFAIPFLLIEPTDLMVTLNGVQVTSGFALTGVGNPTSTATFTVAPAGDLLFVLMVPFERLTDYQENGDLLALTLNNDLDRIWQALKELRRDDSRSLTVSPLEPEGIPPLPVKLLRASKMLAFTVDGDPVPSNLTLGQLEAQPALALASAQAAAASAVESAGFRDSSGEYALAAQASKNAAASSATLAQRWANEAEDVPVSGGLFSAFHWAQKAAGVVASVLSQLAGKLNITDKRVDSAWVTFRVSAGVVTVVDQFNVSSVSRSSAGIYQINLQSALSNANAGIIATGSAPSTAYSVVQKNTAFTQTTSAIGICSVSQSGGTPTPFDPAEITVVVKGGR